jgi:hypothetical protein
MRREVWLAVAGLCMLLVLTPSRAADEETIQRAIDRGVAYLKGAQGQDGKWANEASEGGSIGATALCALTLLECGVPPSDAKIQKAAAAVREAAVTVDRTYSIALSIMFLDRLGEPVDVTLIESLTMRLMAGQDSGQAGGWSYTCPVSQADEARLRTALAQQSQLSTAPKPAEGSKPAEGTKPRDFKDLPPQIQAQWNAVNGGGGGGAVIGGAAGDNSNTQFATLGLWVGRRQGIPVEKALAKVENRFRTTQMKDGGWGYTPPPAGIGAVGLMPGMNGSTPSMTCAGLIGLAAGYGVGTETALRTAGRGADLQKVLEKLPDPGNDPSIKAGLKFVANLIDNPAVYNPQTGQLGGGPPAGVGPGPAVGSPPGLGTAGLGLGSPQRTPHYFLWSVERIAVCYGLETIEGKDWYRWGCGVLLPQQSGEGSWGGDSPGIGFADTCFALLFLKRANLAGDLSAHIKSRKSSLRAGGVELIKESKNNPGSKSSPKDDKTTPTKPGGGETKPGGSESKPSPTKEQPEAAPPSRASDPEAARLSNELVNAPAASQEQVLEKLRDSKGALYTEALTDAILRLTGAAKSKARDALAERFTRMTAKTLKDKMEDSEAEVRRAAALACGMKDDKTLLPQLIELLQDKEPVVMRAAHAALKSLSGEDFGPADGNPGDLKRAVDAWKAWLVKTNGK